MIDNQLDEEVKGRLLARLAEDERLRTRYEALRNTGILIAGSPARKCAASSAARHASFVECRSRGRRSFSGVALRDLAAGFALGLLAAGAAAWVGFSGAPSDDRADWRSAVAEYMELYTNETFALRNPDQTIEALKLNVVAKRVAVALTPEKVWLPGLRFESADLLSYGGAPLGEIAYVDSRGSPVLFCIIANGGADIGDHSEKRGGLAMSSWSHGGRGYLVTGHMPEGQIAKLAQTLKTRF